MGRSNFRQSPHKLADAIITVGRGALEDESSGGERDYNLGGWVRLQTKVCESTKQQRLAAEPTSTKLIRLQRLSIRHIPCAVPRHERETREGWHRLQSGTRAHPARRAPSLHKLMVVRRIPDRDHLIGSLNAPRRWHPWEWMLSLHLIGCHPHLHFSLLHGNKRRGKVHKRRVRPVVVNVLFDPRSCSFLSHRFSYYS